MLTAILTTATGDATAMLAYAGQLFTDLQVWLYVAIGIPVGFYLVRRTIGLVRSMGR
jgi:hypothetical protein